MKLLCTLALGALAAGCGAQREAAVVGNEIITKAASPVASTRPGGGGEAIADCPLRIEFGSYAMGIDPTAARAVRELLSGDPGVASLEDHPWGREGENTICVVTRSEADADRLFHAIAASFPADPLGPLTVSTRTGLRHSAGRR